MTMVREVLYEHRHHRNGQASAQPLPAKTGPWTSCKHIPADKDGVRIAELDEQSYRVSAVEPQTPDGFLDDRTRHRQAAGKPTASTPWGTWHGFQSMGKIVCMRFLAWMQKSLLTTHGVRTLRHGTNPKAAKPSTNKVGEGTGADLPVPTKPSSSSGRWRKF